MIAKIIIFKNKFEKKFPFIVIRLHSIDFKRRLFLEHAGRQVVTH